MILDGWQAKQATGTMILSPGDGANKWRCESCIYYPPSSFGGKPCSYCWEDDPYLDQYRPVDMDYER